jgi:hypothetical protein
MATRRRTGGAAERGQLAVVTFLRSALLRLAGPEPYEPHAARDLALFNAEIAGLRAVLGLPPERHGSLRAACRYSAGR